MELHARRGYILDSNPTRIHSDNWRRRPLPSLTWTAEAGLSSQDSSSSAPEFYQWLSVAALFLARTKPFLADYTFQKQISSIRITLQMQKHYSIKIREPSGYRNVCITSNFTNLQKQQQSIKLLKVSIRSAPYKQEILQTRHWQKKT